MGCGLARRHGGAAGHRRRPATVRGDDPQAVAGHRPDRLAAAIGTWLAARIPAPAPGSRRAIAVEGKTLRGSRTRDTTARHVLAAADHDTGVVLASTDVDTKTNEITRFADLLDQINDLRDVVVTADALHLGP
jgi:hypothetical protein